MLVNTREMLKNALENNYAIAHFNINNLEWAKNILEECQANNSPVIIGISESAIKYMGGYNVVAGIVVTLMKDENITIPVALHLDHGSSFESCKSAIDAGFTSVMIDASKHELEKNIEITKQVVDYAKKYDVTVEAEIGHIGGASGVADEEFFAKTEECEELLNQTGIDSLAPALGSVHGIYKGEPKLNFDRMLEIRNKLNIPLVLHGGTGIPDADIKKAISCGIAKLNINTELQLAWTTAVRKFLNENSEVYDPRKVIGSGTDAMKKSISDKLQLLGCCNKI